MSATCTKVTQIDSIHNQKQTTWTTTTTTTIVNNHLRLFVWDYLGESVPEETFSHLHLSWSSTILYQLPPSATIDNILPVQFTH